MSARYVNQTAKDKGGDITASCNSRETCSPSQKATAIAEIESKAHQYKVAWADGSVTDIHVVNGPTGKYLRTDKDATTRNNLDDLPDCYC